MSEHMDEEALALPAWLGPDKMFILDKAGAFRFGIFHLDRHSFAFAEPESVVVTGAWADVRVDWPRVYAGAALRIRSVSDTVVVAFARPFPESPGPDPGTAEKAAELLSAAANLPVGAALQAGTSILGDAMTTWRAINDLRAGRVIGNRIKEALSSTSARR